MNYTDLAYYLSRDSATIDQELGFQVHAIEGELLDQARNLRPDGSLKNWGLTLHKGNQTWIGLDPEILQTPYAELKLMCELLAPKSGSHLVDLGAGYGRLALVLNAYDQNVRFTGFEFVAERVAEGRKRFKDLGLSQSELIQQDLTDEDFKLPSADYYFIYDYGMVAHIRHTLEQLKAMADEKSFKVVARGRGVRSLIENEHPWLSQVYGPHHEENFSIYSMAL